VLTNNFRQAQAIDRRTARARQARGIPAFHVADGGQRLDRALEGVPSDDALVERKALTPRTRGAVVACKTYIKVVIRSSVTDAVIPERSSKIPGDP
jgi:NAD-specific glutamate dehydrogenase